MYSLLKSKVGAFPEPQFPQGIDLSAEDRKARRRLYPVTVVYATQLAVLAWECRYVANSMNLPPAAENNKETLAP